ncbi:helix-turn-helix transcriptional regulator [uncultured Dokdonia sp.]|uniref:helix-turn-helix domain-containing protein n=1 Tax=uncultured Dokdonia sp. TaxID=575653 RepID=UPI002626C7C4|nr:helix-turn-helix transcriptional regulator [uncultured Dokdonia sp.]
MQGGNTLLTILLLLGTLQGLITVVVLYRLQVNKNANRRLAWILLLISLACLNLYLLNAVTVSSVVLDVLQMIVPLVVIMPVGPLLYFYVRALLYPEDTLSKKDKRHFYTVILDLIPQLIVLVCIIGGFLGVLPNTDMGGVGDWIDGYNTYVDIPRWLSLVVYLWFSYTLWKQQSVQQKETASAKWAQRFLMGFTIFAGIWALHLIPYTIPNVSNYLLSYVGWYPVYIPLVILVYWLGVNGYIIGYKAITKSSVSTVASPEVITKTVTALETLMNKEQWYLKPTLKLQDVVQHTGIPQKTISSVLNQHLGKSFNEYVNTYRITEFKKRILDPSSENLTITGVAYDCGFNSQATFQRVFKKMTQQSPKEFKESQEKN